MSSDNLAPYARRRAARHEDLIWMADNGETPVGAAQRIGLNPKALERWCMRHAPDLWQHLTSNARLPGHLPAGRVTQQRTN